MNVNEQMLTEFTKWANKNGCRTKSAWKAWQAAAERYQQAPTAAVVTPPLGWGFWRRSAKAAA